MRINIPKALNELGIYIEKFVALGGRKRWFKRADQLELEANKSPYRWKIVSDYHWLEMAISFQADVLEKEGQLIPHLVDHLILASLNFAATAVEVHAQLSPKGKRVLEGRIRDSLKAETGFAALYLELDLAQRLVDAGYDVQFPDMEGTGQFDLLFRRDAFVGEVECKSLSADAGRPIHRKDFYRFIEKIQPILQKRLTVSPREVLVITLVDRLSPSAADQSQLLKCVEDILSGVEQRTIATDVFKLELVPYPQVLQAAPVYDQRAFYNACNRAFGPNTHVAGAVTEDCGCLIVMRSQREDDTSKPMLEAMRKAASQFSGQRPAFIAIQEHGIEAPDLMLPHVRRRAGILSYALFGHYGADHVNATYFTGFGAVVHREGQVGTPAFVGSPGTELEFAL